MKLHPIEASPIHARRERVFLIMAGLFIGTLAMLNILGITRFIKLGELVESVAAKLVLTRSPTELVVGVVGRAVSAAFAALPAVAAPSVKVASSLHLPAECPRGLVERAHSCEFEWEREGTHTGRDNKRGR